MTVLSSPFLPFDADHCSFFYQHLLRRQRHVRDKTLLKASVTRPTLSFLLGLEVSWTYDYLQLLNAVKIAPINALREP